MKKRIALVLTLLFLFAGCSAETFSEKNDEKFITFTDDLGRKISISSPERVAPLLGSFADIWMLAGGEIAATADDAWDDFGLNLSETTINLGPTKNMSLELLIAAEPDFVIASTKTAQHVQWRETLEAAGITVAYFEVQTFDDYLRMLKICTDITGREDLYKKYGTEVKDSVDEVISRIKEKLSGKDAPKVLFLRASATWIRAKNNEGTVLGEMLSDLGCVNIADSDNSLLENLSLESIVEKNPHYILVVQSGDDAEGMKKAMDDMFSENPAWNEIDAVKGGNVIYLDKMLFNLKPNERWAEAYEILERIFEK